MSQNTLSGNWWVTLCVVLFWADTQGNKDKHVVTRRLADTFSREIPKIVALKVKPDELNSYFDYNHMVAQGFYEDVRTTMWGLEQHQSAMVDVVVTSIKAAGSIAAYMANYRR